MSDMKRFTRIATDAAGGSIFQDDEFPIDAPPGVTGRLTGTVPAASGAVYVRHDSWDGAAQPQPHTAPRRQWVVLLRGTVEVEVTDGSRRTFGPGDLLRAEDTGGIGHITRPVGDLPIEALYLPG